MLDPKEVTTPIRIQRRRSKGWRMPEGAVSVTRPGRYGNPFTVWRDNFMKTPAWFVWKGSCRWPVASKAEGAALAVQMHVEWLQETKRQTHHDAERPDPVDIIKDLRGKNLACWCALDQPCHADTLLRIANGPLACEAV